MRKTCFNSGMTVLFSEVTGRTIELTEVIIVTYHLYRINKNDIQVRLCGLVVRVSGY
jgi:hypothetical protein